MIFNSIKYYKNPIRYYKQYNSNISYNSINYINYNNNISYNSNNRILSNNIVLNNSIRYISNNNNSISIININNKNNNSLIIKREYVSSYKIKEYISNLTDGLFLKDKIVVRDYILNKEKLDYYLDNINSDDIAIKKELDKLLVPLAKKSQYSFQLHDSTINDPYHWLQDLNDPKVQDYIDQENNYCEAYESIALNRLSKKVKSVFHSISVDHPTDSEVINGHTFIVKNKSLYRVRKSDSRSERLLQDGSKVNGYTIHLKDVISFKFSEDDGFFSFVMEVDSNENKICVVKKLSDYHLPKLVDIIENVTSIEWGKYNDLYYTQTDEKSKRPHKLFKKLIYESELVNRESQPLLIMEEINSSNFLDIIKSKDNKILFYCSNNIVSTLVYYVNLVKEKDVNANSHKVLLSRVDGLEYYAEHNNDQFIIFANANKRDLNIYSVRDTIENGDFKDLELLVASENACVIRDVDVYQDYLVVVELNNFSPRIRIIKKNLETGHFDSTNQIIVKFPQEIIQLSLGVNIDYNSDSEFSLTYTTPVENITPAKVSLKDGQVSLLPGSKERGPLVLFPNNYITKVLWVPSKSDPSIKIPLSIAYHKDLKLDGKNPCILHGYGSYGNINELSYNLEDAFFLNGGMIVAKAHVRGGGELGRSWYKDGKLLNKKNTFKDYIDCVEYLFDNGYTSPEYLIGKGSSAGGLLMCNVCLTHPQYFSGIISRVPFVDLITSMMDEELPLTIHEFDEWGNLNKDKQVFNYIKEYDPYLLIDALDISKLKSFPHLYVTGSSCDFRVPFWQPLKWVAKLRNHFNKYNSNLASSNNQKSIDPLILLNIDDNSGHFGPNDRDSLTSKFSKEISFIFDSIKTSLKNKEIRQQLQQNNNKY